MGDFHKGKYIVKNPEKYTGDAHNVVYRSSWEKMVMIWLDKNTDVLKWGSECIVINYKSKVDGKLHRYFTDFNILLKSGKKLLVEVKPKCQTKEPVLKSPKHKKRFITEVETYAKNISKWEQASKFAKENGAEFVVWTEDTLAELGLPIQTSKAFKFSKFANKKMTPKRKD